MSTKSTIFLTNDSNEHCYFDSIERHISKKDGKVKDEITIEFDKRNVEINQDDDEAIIITINNVDSELYNIFKNLGQIVPDELK